MMTNEELPDGSAGSTGSNAADAQPSEPTRDEILSDWSARLSLELGLDGLEIDIDAVLKLAGVAAHSIVRPAAPLTTFIVGYAAGLAAADGRLTPEAAVEAASATALQLAQSEPRAETVEPE